ncbi:UNVERIFIED_CONTAM: Mitochondrial import inner membrane translocase subunit TIM14-3 [Sesamum angustifolium]|uniref:Mitochondrial import inner membrane translocase subunit TIM14-3 n=1 Tax=Sesamum angustifolium TaxID=2727405 RepID=A0AAW2LHA9_9LAMI
MRAWEAFKARPVVPRARKFYPGGFEQVMTRREAALILGVREHTVVEKIREAHRRVMVANHPDAGGSHYLASKINEAKDVLLRKAGHRILHSDQFWLQEDNDLYQKNIPINFILAQARSIRQSRLSKRDTGHSFTVLLG